MVREVAMGNAMVEVSNRAERGQTHACESGGQAEREGSERADQTETDKS